MYRDGHKVTRFNHLAKNENPNDSVKLEGVIDMTVIKYLTTRPTPSDPLHLYIRTETGSRKVLQVIQGRMGYQVVYLGEDGSTVRIDVSGITELLES